MSLVIDPIGQQSHSVTGSPSVKPLLLAVKTARRFRDFTGNSITAELTDDPKHHNLANSSIRNMWKAVRRKHDC